MVGAAVAMSAVLAFTLGHQVTRLVDDFPQYEKHLNAKIATLRSDGKGFTDKLRIIVGRVTRQLEKVDVGVLPQDNSGKQAQPVRIVRDDGPLNIAALWRILAPVLEPIASIGLALILLVFMLMRREDLRDRILKLAGRGRLVATTKMLDEAGERISRYLLLQLVVNASYGAALALGLMLIGVPYALLWGVIAAVLRYVPYIGPWIAAVFPVALSMLMADGWQPVVWTLALFGVLELVSNLWVEPMLYGRGIGVSETATLIMVAFWTWLWGPVGLVLATPLTVCVVVLGRNVPQLRFFDTLLGDRQVLSPDVRFYQRLLARDAHEAAHVAQAHAREHGLLACCDEVVLPALAYGRRDRVRDLLSEDDERWAVQASRDVAMLLASELPADAEETDSASPLGPVRVLMVPVRDDAAEVAAFMFTLVLDPKAFACHLAWPGMLSSEVVDRAQQEGSAVVTLIALSHAAAAQAQLICIRLRERLRDLPIVVVDAALDEGLAAEESMRERLKDAGANAVAATLEQARATVCSFRLHAPGPPLPLVVSLERADTQ